MSKLTTNQLFGEANYQRYKTLSESITEEKVILDAFKKKQLLKEEERKKKETVKKTS